MGRRGLKSGLGLLACGVLLAGALLGGLLVVATKLHLPEDAFALHLLLQRPQRLVDVVVTDMDLHVLPKLLSPPEGSRRRGSWGVSFITRLFACQAEVNQVRPFARR